MLNETRVERKPSGHFKRYRKIAMVLAKYRLEQVLKYVGMGKYVPFRWLLRGNPWRKLSESRPERVRLAIEELGTFFVKLGQIMSTRSDLLPPEYTKELTKLQSNLNPLPVEVMKDVIIHQFGRPLEEVFTNFNPQPLGVASIGQVYSCSLIDGTEVVVKVQKPGVPELIEEDMYILARAAESATRSWSGAEQYDLVGIVHEISDTIKLETDYLQEGHNAEYFARLFEKDRNIHIPKIYWDYTSARVLTMERIQGTKILDIEELDKKGFNRKELAIRAVNMWLKMVFESEAFHADPHPGNLYVEPDGRLGLLDFGMVGLIDDEVRWNLATALKAILDREPDLLIDALIELGAVNLRDEGCRSCLRKDVKYVMVHYPIIYLLKPSDTVNSNLGQLFTLLRNNRIQLPATTFMMLKTVIMAQSLGRGLDPEFDILPLLEANINQIIRKRYSLISALRRMPAATVEMATLAGGLPQRLNRLLKTVERGEIKVSADVTGVEKHIHHLESLMNRALLVMIGVALILGLALFLVGRLG